MHKAREKRGPLTVLLAVAVSIAVALLIQPTTAGATASGSPMVAKTDQGKMKSVVTGTTEDGRKVRGTFTPLEFKAMDEDLAVEGVIDGVIRGKGAPETFTVVRTLTVTDMSAPSQAGAGLGAGGKGMPAAGEASGCDILNLVLGPLDLDLLGLQVHLNQVVLDIIAQPGPGNLLGNLLCAVAGLLDDGTPLSDLLDDLLGFLEDILGALNLGV